MNKMDIHAVSIGIQTSMHLNTKYRSTEVPKFKKYIACPLIENIEYFGTSRTSCLGAWKISETVTYGLKPEVSDGYYRAVCPRGRGSGDEGPLRSVLRAHAFTRGQTPPIPKGPRRPLPDISGLTSYLKGVQRGQAGPGGDSWPRMYSPISASVVTVILSENSAS